MLRRAVLLLPVVIMGCSSSDEVEDPPVSVVVAPSLEEPRAFFTDGDALVIAYPDRLDRVDPATGRAATVAGAGWRTCPTDTKLEWEGYLDEKPVVMRGSTLFLQRSNCGLWSFDIATGARHTLVDTSGDAPKWNGVDGPAWAPTGMALANDGDGLIGCFSTTTLERDELVDRLEVWSFGTDGTPGERLAAIDELRGETLRCERVAADAEAVFFTTSHGRIQRVDRATRATTSIYGDGARLVTADVSDVVFIDKNAIKKVPKRGEALVVTVNDDPRAGFRSNLVVDGGHIYVVEGDNLVRMTTAGTDAKVLARGSESNRVLGTTLAVAGGWVYYQRQVPKTAEEIYDPEYGAYDYAKYKGAVERTAK